MEQSMEPMLKRKPLRLLLALLLCLSLIITSAIPTVYAADPLYSNASDWAKPEIQKASDTGLLPVMLKGKDLTQPATREELCELAVLLYEKLGKQSLVPVSPNPFTDTTNPQILKALGIGITKGTTNTTFSPDSKTTREQVATMFGRAIRSLYAQLDYSTAGAPAFTDQSLISSYALGHVLYMSKEGILKGSNGKFMPRPVTQSEIQSNYGTTRREEAIAITVRIYAAYLNTPVMLAVSDKEKMALSFLSIDPVTLSPQARFDQIDFNKRVFRPVYQPKLTLSVGDSFDSSGNRTYSSAPNSVLVRNDGTGIHPFRWQLPADVLSRTSSIVWQVSKVPFDGKPTGALTAKPPGLLLSGTLPKTSTSFNIDFKKVHQYAAVNLVRKNLVGALDLSPNLIPSSLPKLDPLLGWNVNALQIEGKGGNSLPTTYYVRAYPVDSYGASIGDTGSGLPIQYGDPVPAKQDGLISVISKNFSLQSAEKQGAISTQEFPNLYGTYSERPMWNTSSKLYYFRPSGFPANTQELILQVTMTTPSSVAGSAWQNVSGLVYEKSYFPSDQIYRDMVNYSNSGISIDFTSLVPSDTQLGDQKIPYYVRFVALTKGSYPAGSVNAKYSDPVTILYQKSQATTVKFLPQVKIDPDIPTITGFSYHPVQWEDPNWEYRYVIFRQPTYQDVFGSLAPSDQPYTKYPVGAKLDLTPQPVQDQSWWEEAWDAISNFLSDLGSFLKDLTNWVANAYNGLKSGLINFIAQALPFGEPIDGLLKTAIEGMVNYGLMTVGLPPSLPNFDELANLGTDYLATVALQQAGIPADDTLIDGAKTLGEGIGKELTSSSKSATPNPLDWNFVKYDPDYLYKPGYILITLQNQTGEATPKGTLNFSTSCYLDPLSNQGKNNTQDIIWNKYGVPYISVYKPISMEIPSMAPDQIMTVPIFLEEYYGVPFPGKTQPVDRGFLRMMYWDLGKHEFNVSIGFELKPLAQEVQERKLPADAIYSYSTLGLSRTFTIEPYNPVN